MINTPIRQGEYELEQTPIVLEEVVDNVDVVVVVVDDDEDDENANVFIFTLTFML
jgi:division protein CdvB (Snf7/Vps24/ESCRT-III family)